MRRALVLACGVTSYALFLLTFLYAIGFVGGIGVPTSLDGAPRSPLGMALMVNLGLLALFAVQHSVMARPAFKRAWTKIVPPAMERSTYVLLSNLALILLFWKWQPMGGTVWNFTDSTARVWLFGLSLCGWMLVLVSTFLINHFDLFGLRQVWAHFRGRDCEPLRFVVPGPYRMVRHPLYVGFILAFWATPTMSAAHLLFAVMTTAYILVAIQLEERDLVAEHGASYKDYRRRVPMLIPGRMRRQAEAQTVPAQA